MFDDIAKERLGSYVYALFDPAQPDLPFYVGKGSGNRVFQHASCELPVESVETEPMSLRIEKIHAISASGKNVVEKIIRYGLSSEVALVVEAALIDMVNLLKPDTLTNEISGQGNPLGIMDAIELETALCAPQLQTTLPVLLIKIERRWGRLIDEFKTAASIPSDRILKAVSGNWVIDVNHAEKARYILAVARGIVRGVYHADRWQKTSEANRKCFEGNEAQEAAAQSFVGMSVTSLFSPGSQNPIRYLNC